MDTISDTSSMRISIKTDPIEEWLIELSEISSAWRENHDKNRPATILRRALIGAAQEITDNIEIYLKQECDSEKELINAMQYPPNGSFLSSPQ